MQHLDFDNWYNFLLQELKARGYDQPPDTAIAQSDYDMGFSPETSCEMFIKQWNLNQEPPMMGMSY